MVEIAATLAEGRCSFEVACQLHGVTDRAATYWPAMAHEIISRVPGKPSDQVTGEEPEAAVAAVRALRLHHRGHKRERRLIIASRCVSAALRSAALVITRREPPPGIDRLYRPPEFDASSPDDLQAFRAFVRLSKQSGTPGGLPCLGVPVQNRLSEGGYVVHAFTPEWPSRISRISSILVLV
jgi:hypothetical protein